MKKYKNPVILIIKYTDDIEIGPLKYTFAMPHGMETPVNHITTVTHQTRVSFGFS